MRRYGVISDVVDEFKSLDEFNSFHTSHNSLKFDSNIFKFDWIKFV